jgi:hypothetical protein
MKKLIKSGLRILPFPKGAAAELSMLDNSLFRDYKRDFAAEWEKEEDVSKKEEVALLVWNAFPEERINNYWKKSGYLAKASRKTSSVEKRKKKLREKKNTTSRTIVETAPISSFFCAQSKL